MTPRVAQPGTPPACPSCTPPTLAIQLFPLVVAGLLRSSCPARGRLVNGPLAGALRAVPAGNRPPAERLSE
jgi:hypothetical protein